MCKNKHHTTGPILQYPARGCVQRTGPHRPSPNRSRAAIKCCCQAQQVAYNVSTAGYQSCQRTLEVPGEGPYQDLLLIKSPFPKMMGSLVSKDSQSRQLVVIFNLCIGLALQFHINLPSLNTCLAWYLYISRFLRRRPQQCPYPGTVKSSRSSLTALLGTALQS